MKIRDMLTVSSYKGWGWWVGKGRGGGGVEDGGMLFQLVAIAVCRVTSLIS